MYTITSVEGKSKGVVATTDIQAGATIVDEKAVVDPEKYDGLVASVENEKRLAKHHGGKVSDVRLITACIRASPDYAQIMTMTDGLEKKCKGKTEYGVFMTNALPKGSCSRFGALFLVCSRFNHSCTPNAYHFFNESTGCERIYSTRDIRAGEEICTAYIDVMQASTTRRSELRTRFGFTCICDVCTKSDDASDERRSRLAKLDTLILASTNDSNAGLDYVREYQDILREEDLCNLWTMKRSNYDGFQFAMMAKNKDLATDYIREVLRISELIGDPPEELQKYRALASDPDSWDMGCTIM